MNTRTPASFLKSQDPRVLQLGALVLAFVIPVTIVWCVKRLGWIHPHVDVNPKTQAAAYAARTFFEPARLTASGKRGDYVQPPVAVLPSAYQRLELDLERKKQSALDFPGTAKARMTEIANCATSPVLPHNEKIRCVFAAHEIYRAVNKGKGKDPILDTEFDRAVRGTDPLVRNHVELYYATQARIKAQQEKKK